MIGIIFILRGWILTLYPAMILQNLLAEEQVRDKWNFSIAPRLLDGTDGILEAKLLNKPIWDVLHYEPIELPPLKCGFNTLVVMVHSATGHKDRRDLIRKYNNIYRTMGVYQKLGDVKVFFVIGKDTLSEVNKQVDIETFRYGDIIRGDFIDHYFNMTIKNVYGKVKIHQFCQFKFLLKTDDDVFINFPVVLLNLKKLKPNYPGLYLGWPCISGAFSYPHLIENRRVFTDRLQNFNFTLSDFPFPFAPKYSYGFSYVLSKESVDVLVNEYKYIPYIRIIDDFYIAYVLSRFGITCCQTPGFVFEMSKDGGSFCHLTDVLTWNFRIRDNDLQELENVYKYSLTSWISCTNSFSQLLNQRC